MNQPPNHRRYSRIRLSKNKILLSLLCKKENIYLKRINLNSSLLATNILERGEKLNPSQQLIQWSETHLKSTFGAHLLSLESEIDHDFPLKTDYWKIFHIIEFQELPLSHIERQSINPWEKLYAYSSFHFS